MIQTLSLNSDRLGVVTASLGFFPHHPRISSSVNLCVMPIHSTSVSICSHQTCDSYCRDNYGTGHKPSLGPTVTATAHEIPSIHWAIYRINFYNFAEPLDPRILFSIGTHGFPCCDMHVIAKQSNNLCSQAKLLLTAGKQVSSNKSRESSRHGAVDSFWALPLPKWEPHTKIPPQHIPKITWVWKWERVAWGQMWGLAGCWHCAEAHLHVRQLLIPAYFPDKIWIA